MKPIHIFLAATMGALAVTPAEVEAEPGKFCWSIQKARVVPCPIKPPVPECEQTEFCDEHACWCGPHDAYMGPDHTGLPVIARELEAGGWPCSLADDHGVTIGECSGWYSWICDAGSRCSDDVGNRWWPAPAP